MTQIKTEWHLAELDGDDPFDAVTFTPGVTIDLTADEDELAEQFARLLKREGRYARNGLTCELKEGGQDCLTCPVGTLDPEEDRSRLCRLGKDQSTVEKRCATLTEERRGSLDELAARAEEASEIGHLDDELVEILTAHGL